jgi:AraC-like DNA-binding protein
MFLSKLYLFCGKGSKDAALVLYSGVTYLCPIPTYMALKMYLIDELYIRLFYARYVRLAPSGWKWKNLQNSYWRLYLNDSAGATIRLSQTEYQLQPNQFYFVPAGVRFDTDLSITLGHFYVHFDIIGLPSIAMREFFDGVLAVPTEKLLLQKAYGLVECLKVDETPNLARQCQVKALVYENLANYLASLDPTQTERSLQLGQALRAVAPALEYIETHLAERLYNGELAALCNLNEDYFIRRFRQSVGQSPGEYIRSQRLKRAAQQLVFTSASLDEIAARTGFGSRFYLTRLFSRYMHISPVAYRQASAKQG